MHEKDEYARQYRISCVSGEDSGRNYCTLPHFIREGREWGRGHASTSKLVFSRRCHWFLINHFFFEIHKKGHHEIAARPYGILAAVKDGQAFTQNEWGADFCPTMRPHPSDKIVKGKSGLCGFYSTNLDFLLRQAQIRNVLLGGFLTNCCVESSMRTGNSCWEVHRCIQSELCNVLGTTVHLSHIIVAVGQPMNMGTKSLR